MFFFTYLGRELRRRMRQAIVIALGLALGVGLVITVSAASSGIKKAQDDVLSSLYGVGTDVTVTQKPAPPKGSGSKTSIRIGGPPGSGSVGAQECANGKCHTLKGGVIDTLTSMNYGTIGQDWVTRIAGRHDVASAVGGLILTATNTTIPSSASQNFTPPATFTVDGLDLSHLRLGPFSSGTIRSGRTFTSADAGSDVAVVDADYARANKLKVGSKVTIAQKPFRVIGIIRQAQGSGAPNVYIPLARAQALATKGLVGSGHLTNDINTVYVSAASSADIATVQKEISSLLPHATVTTAASLASEVTGSLSSTAKLANDLGRWLAVLVLIAAFAVASLLTVAAVSRRVREFGTLKALGWRGRRLTAQVLGETITTGILGGAAGVGLGYLGAELITKIAPKLYAKVSEGTGQHFFGQVGNSAGGPGPIGTRSLTPNATHTVGVPLVAHVGLAAVIAAVLLAILGGLLAGAIGSWRMGRLRPAVALATVE
jgi:putative ABC transport system permease protein